MKSNLLFVLLVLSLNIFGQKEYNDGEIEIKYMGSKKVSPNFHLSSLTYYEGESIEKIKIVCKIKSLNRRWVDINKISLVDKENKIRYRPSDISFSYGYYKKLLKEDLNIKGLFGNYEADAFYKPEIKDTFEDYIFDGYTNYDFPYNFGSKKKPQVAYVYFESHQFLKFKALIFFPIMKSAENPSFELYYENEKISNVKI